MAFKAAVLDELRRHGLEPRAGVTPAELRDAIHARYLEEVRALREGCRAGEFPRRELAARVGEIRKRYALLSLPLHLWVE
jgi:hypothetical protein